MKIIQSQYRVSYKSDEDTRFALAIMNRVFGDWEYTWIEKALFYFMQTNSDFPPKPGQLVTIAKELRRAEWNQKQREMDLLPEPEIEKSPMPEYLREKLNEIFGGAD